MSSQLISEDLLKQTHHSLHHTHENSFVSAAAHHSAHTFLAGVGVLPSPDSPATSARAPSETPRLAPPRHLASNVQAPWSSAFGFLYPQFHPRRPHPASRLTTHMITKSHKWILNINLSSDCQPNTTHSCPGIYETSQVLLLPPPPHIPAPPSCPLIPLPFIAHILPVPQEMLPPLTSGYIQNSITSCHLPGSCHAPATTASPRGCFNRLLTSVWSLLRPPTEWLLCSSQNGAFKCKSLHITFLLRALYWLPTHSEQNFLKMLERFGSSYIYLLFFSLLPSATTTSCLNPNAPIQIEWHCLSDLDSTPVPGPQPPSFPPSQAPSFRPQHSSVLPLMQLSAPVPTSQMPSLTALCKIK